MPDANNPLTTPAQMQYSPAFLKADADMAKLTGDKVPQSLRYQYWTLLHGDDLAKIDPRTAALAYDTAIMANPQKAFELVKQTGGDPTKMYQARNAYAQQMVAVSLIWPVGPPWPVCPACSAGSDGIPMRCWACRPSAWLWCAGMWRSAARKAGRQGKWWLDMGRQSIDRLRPFAYPQRRL
jgi:hypothetical protein